eukprot:CAMPEP_0196744538 /NCGR_PEP_ID=MMETSP1091-20130531/57993_1 /TAXON_ID=302021 /ORGANISM="Rhodomonas sp., Strain CCMP768" /LENGTH=100 /DNA_ID=CAMNT_0042091099 /DNA_START=382 /DNA_END=681 /DNA_ORIENTATION=+
MSGPTLFSGKHSATSLPVRFKSTSKDFLRSGKHVHFWQHVVSLALLKKLNSNVLFDEEASRARRHLACILAPEKRTLGISFMTPELPEPEESAAQLLASR